MQSRSVAIFCLFSLNSLNKLIRQFTKCPLKTDLKSRSLKSLVASQTIKRNFYINYFLLQREEGRKTTEKLQNTRLMDF
jgi:hypothetical protein